MKNILTCLAFGCLCFATHGANTWYVALNGDDVDNDGKSWDHPFATIQKGLSSCVNKDTVIVSNGTYVIDSQLEITSQQVNLMSLTGNPADVIIDCRECRGIFSSSWKSSVVGVTVQNGRSDTAGAGICLATSALVSNCVVRSCSVIVIADNKDGYGGGIRCQQGSDVVDCLVENCVVSNATQTSKNNLAQGGGIYNIGTVRGCTVRNCAVYNRNGYYGRSVGGGIYAESQLSENQYPASIIDCTVCSNKIVLLTKSPAGEGGGIGFVGSSDVSGAQTISNCHVFDNASPYVGGGICIIGPVELVDSAIESNRVWSSDESVRYDNYNGGGGVYVRGAGGAVRRCRISENSVQSAPNKQTNGGGGIRLSGSGTVIADSVVCENSSSRYGAAVFFGSTTSTMTFGGAVISNCWIASNSAASSGIIAGNEGDGLVIVNCGIVSNSVLNGSALHWVRSSDKTSGVLFRNSLFSGNVNTFVDGSAIFGLSGMTTSCVAPVGFEFCSFINESILSGTSNNAILGQKGTDATANAGNVSVVGCLLYGDAEHPYTRLSVNTAGAAGNTVRYTRSENAPVDDPSLGNFDGTTDPLFADAANGNFRYAAGSPLVDKGGAAQAWMGQGRKSGPMDLGDGTVSLTKSADYGVNVAFNNARPRLSNGMPDIGCFEFYVPNGLVVLFK